MQRYHRFEDVSWAASANRLCRLDSAPPGKRIREIILFCDFAGTKDAADTLDGQLFAKAISMIKIGNFVQIPGWELNQLQHQVYGRVIEDPTDIPGSGTTFDMEFSLRIPFRDPRQPTSDDGSIPCDMLREKSLEITLAAANVHGVGSLVITAGTIRVMAEIVDEVDIPQLNQIGFEDPGSLTHHVKEGVYKDLFIVDGAAGGGTITRAEIASVDFEADGRMVLNNALHEQIVSAYNGNGLRSPTGELTHNAASRLPLVWHDSFGKANISKQVLVEQTGRIQLTGTITAPRYVYWRAMAKDDTAVAQLAKATGAPVDATSYQPATATKTPLMSAVVASQKGAPQPTKSRVLTSVLRGKVRTPGAAR